MRVNFLAQPQQWGHISDLWCPLVAQTLILTLSFRRALNSCSFLWVVSMWENRAALPSTQGCCRASRTLRRLQGSRTMSLLTCSTTKRNRAEFRSHVREGTTQFPAWPMSSWIEVISSYYKTGLKSSTQVEDIFREFELQVIWNSSE